MPDLDIVTTWTCSTNQFWSKEVQGDSGKTYTVRFEHRPWPHEVQYDYTCTCPAFRFGNSNNWGKERYCKHIEAVKHLRCGWNGELEPTAEPESGGPDNRPVCPDCGADVIPIRVGV